MLSGSCFEVRYRMTMRKVDCEIAQEEEFVGGGQIPGQTTSDLRCTSLVLYNQKAGIDMAGETEHHDSREPKEETVRPKPSVC